MEESSARSTGKAERQKLLRTQFQPITNGGDGGKEAGDEDVGGDDDDNNWQLFPFVEFLLDQTMCFRYIIPYNTLCTFTTMGRNYYYPLSSEEETIHQYCFSRIQHFHGDLDSLCTSYKIPSAWKALFSFHQLVCVCVL